MTGPFFLGFMRVCGLFRAQKQKRFSIDDFSIKWKPKGFHEQMRGLYLIFQAGGPAFLRFTPFFPVHGCVEVSGFEMDKLMNTSKGNFEPSPPKKGS
jgi:hypothetical protein